MSVQPQFSQARLMQVLLAPRISEKAMQQADLARQFVFKVAADANKQEVKQAVEMLFEVKVSSVQILNVKGKRKSFGRRSGQRSDWKKAYVALQQGYDINFGTE